MSIEDLENKYVNMDDLSIWEKLPLKEREKICNKLWEHWEKSNEEKLSNYWTG